jgi:hypothetical protein
MADNMVTLTETVARLTEAGLSHECLDLTPRCTIVICQRGGRIFGPFFNGAPSLNWMPSAFKDRELFARFIESGHWNIGGERIWIGPEIQYMIPNRANYWGSYDLPKEMDPGDYSLTRTGQYTCRLSQHIEIEAYRSLAERKNLDIDIKIAPVKNPLRFLSEFENLMQAVEYAGYRQEVTLLESQSDDILSESWNLYQVNPGGQLIVPSVPDVEVSDYYEPVGPHLSRSLNVTRVSVTGSHRFKIGFKAPHVFGRLGYINTGADGVEYLLVRNFLNDPSSIYAEESDVAIGRIGDSIHTYNDDGGLGGFGELEVRGRTIGGDSGRSESTDEFEMWCFRGEHKAITRLSQYLLGTY